MAKTELFVRKQSGGMFAVVSESYVPGNLWFVDSATGTDGAGYGRNPDAPVATLDYAIGLATSDSGDVILVAPGHAETLAADVTVDKSDLKIIGLGVGANRPTFTFGAAAREINVTADDVLLKGLRLISGANDLVNFIDADAHDLTVEDCHFETSSANEALCFINLATTKDRLTVRRCVALQPSDPEGTDAAAGTGFIYCVDSEGVKLLDCELRGNFETAIVHNKTTAAKDVYIEGCRIRQELATGLVCELVAGCTGSIARSVCHVPNADDVTEAKLVGAIGTAFWVAGDAWFSNDSAAGGQLMVVGSTATT